MQMILAIAGGGAIGSVLRHFVGKASLAMFGTMFPYGTLLVNIAGCFVMGVFVTAFAQTQTSQEMRAFLTVGLLGGFTTFSTFSLDAMTLYERGEFLMAAGYVLASVVLSLMGIFAGVFLVRSMTA